MVYYFFFNCLIKLFKNSERLLASSCTRSCKRGELKSVSRAAVGAKEIYSAKHTWFCTRVNFCLMVTCPSLFHQLIELYIAPDKTTVVYRSFPDFSTVVFIDPHCSVGWEFQVNLLSRRIPRYLTFFAKVMVLFISSSRHYKIICGTKVQTYNINTE